MSQVNKTTLAPPIPVKQQQRYAAFVAVAVGITVAAVAGGLIVTSLTSAPADIRTAQHVKLVDGSMSAARAAHLGSLHGGYVPSAIAGSMSGVLVDGYLPGLIAAQSSEDMRASDLRDGWESALQDGYLPSFLTGRASGELVDGYLPGLIAAQSSEDTPASDLRDGWESGLTR
jgi:hypothetical protein